MTATVEKIYDEAQRLPEELAREVLDFICFVEARHGIKPLETEAASDWQSFFDRHTRALSDTTAPTRESLYDDRLR